MSEMHLPFGLLSEQRANDLGEAFDDLQHLREKVAEFEDDRTPRWYFARLTEELPAASNALTGFTQAWANCCPYAGNNPDSLDREETTDTAWRIRLTHRNTNVSVATGTFVWVRHINAEYVPFVSGGGGGVFARGTVENPLCDIGCLQVKVGWLSFCGAVPEETYGLIMVKDPDGYMSGHTPGMLQGASVRMSHYYDISEGGYCSSQWELTSIAGLDECMDQE